MSKLEAFWIALGVAGYFSAVMFCLYRAAALMDEHHRQRLRGTTERRDLKRALAYFLIGIILFALAIWLLLLNLEGLRNSHIYP